jgi:hypothetical protein
MEASGPLISGGLSQRLERGQARDLPDDLLSDGLDEMTPLPDRDQEGPRTANDAIPKVAVQALQPRAIGIGSLQHDRQSIDGDVLRYGLVASLGHHPTLIIDPSPEISMT